MNNHTIRCQHHGAEFVRMEARIREQDAEIAKLREEKGELLESRYYTAATVLPNARRQAKVEVLREVRDRVMSEMSDELLWVWLDERIKQLEEPK